MKVLERMTQQIENNKWLELEPIDKKFDVVEGRLGFPPKRRYRLIVGGQSVNTLVIEREWESLAKMEAAYDAGFVDQEYQALQMEMVGIVKKAQIELLMPL